MGQAAFTAKQSTIQPQAHVEDFIYRRKAPADNTGKGRGGGQGYFWQQDVRVCFEWNKQIRFLSIKHGYLKRHTQICFLFLKTVLT